MKEVKNSSLFINPLPSIKCLNTTNDSESFKNINIDLEMELPIPPHCGSFAFRRRYHTHEGIDFYVPDGTEVVAVEDGIITKIEDFTGPKVNQPWWNDTQAIQIEGKEVVVLYGEIIVSEILKVGMSVTKGQVLGNVRQVLTKDKGRPMSMLHLEVHKHGSRDTPLWEPPESPKPNSLLDPTPYFIHLFKK